MSDLIRVIRSGKRRRGAALGRSRRRRLAGGALVTAGAFLLVVGCAFLLVPLSAAPTLVLDAKPAPSRVYDRTGTRLIMEVVSPRAAESRWQTLSAAGGSCVSAAFLAARNIPASDPLGDSFFAPISALGSALLGGNDLAAEAASELAAMRGEDPAPLERTRLAGALAARYGRRPLAEWLLNNRSYGRRTVGVDDAALSYFDRPAGALTTAECAALEALAGEPELTDDPDALRITRDGVLGRMMSLGYIGPEELRTASAETLLLQPAGRENPAFLDSFLARVFARLAARYPDDELARAGLTIITSLDLDFAMQLLCAAQTSLAQGGADRAGSVPALDGGPCRLAALLNPGAGPDGPADLAAAVIDPETGELLAFFESARGGEPDAAEGRAGTALLPFVYLSAFTRGFAPASMLFDIPGTEEIDNLDGLYLGPVSARESLRQRRMASTSQMMDRAGGENISRTLALLGLPAEGDGLDGLLLRRTNLMDVTEAYATVAGGGLQTFDGGSADPVVILRVEDPAGVELEEYAERQSRRVVSPDLAYLVQDVLEDPQVWTGFPAAGLDESSGVISAALAESPADGGAWAFAFSPRFVIGVRASARESSRLTPQTAWSVAQAAAGWASRGLPPQRWKAGAGIVRLEVCEPSGLLPSRYCPNTASEIFLSGAEPSQTDTYYRPVVVNRETGRLATLWTPLALTEARVFFQLSGEARRWAEQSGFPLPPETYDTLPAFFPVREDLQILRPGPMEILRGSVEVRGTASSKGMKEYRLQAGPGLYPSNWFVLAEGKTSVREGNLTLWDTSIGDGIWSIQLAAVFADGKVETTAIPVTIDNTPPVIRLVEPAAAGGRNLEKGQPVVFQAEVTDNLALADVDFRLDGEVRESIAQGPFAVRWENLPAGEHAAVICARDMAGNENCTTPLEFNIRP